MDEEKLKLMQRYVANIAISGSTLRNQGAEGVTSAARAFLSGLDLNVLGETEPEQYPNLLDEWTEQLRARLPAGARNWGTARKALNVFMVQAFMNKYLDKEYGLNKFGDVLETPLDNKAANKLRKRAGGGKLPRWNGIINLREDGSQQYQEFASTVARQERISRACLDIILWRANE